MTRRRRTSASNSLERLREVVRGQIESQFGPMTRQKVKRELLDQLDASYSVRGAVEAGRGRVQQHLEPGQPRPRSGRPHLRRRGDDGRRGARRIYAACRAPRASRPGAGRDRREGRRSGDATRSCSARCSSRCAASGEPAAGSLRVLSQQPERAGHAARAAVRGEGGRPSAGQISVTDKKVRRKS